MLSILIPTYNYNIVPLVKELHKQCSECNIGFEILVYDDDSKLEINSKNDLINQINYCKFKVLPLNIGGSAIRNLLAKESKYENLLFIDADTIPVYQNFIGNYIKILKSDYEVVYGGIKYQEKQPNSDKLLRWTYGKKREALSTSVRNKKPYLSFLTLNFLIKKDVFKIISFNEDIPNLRHEDTLFSYNLEIKNINVIHIENPTYHLGLEESRIFLKKSLESVDAIFLFLKQGLISNDYTLITKVFFKLKKLKLQYTFAFIFTTFKSHFENHLLSKKPSLYLFDLYRLSYLCYLDTN